MASADPVPKRAPTPPRRTRTPWSPIHRTNHQNVRSEMTYKTEDCVLRPQRDDSFIANAKSILAAKAVAAQGHNKAPNALWAALVESAKIRDALNAVLAKSPKAAKYDEVEKLINTISSQYLRALLGKNGVAKETPALICMSRPNNVIPEDYLSVTVKPDWYLFTAQHEALESALAKALPFVLRPWGALDCTGEDKPDDVDDLIGQLKWYVMSNKRFRPDLAAVYGFQLTGNTLRLSCLNACGLVSSEAFDRGNVEAWIALVVLLYHSNETRDTRLTYDPSAICYRDTSQWNISPGLNRPDFSVYPSYSSLCPGRMTWTAFEPGPLPESVPYALRHTFKKRLELAPAVGFLKVSWQRPSISVAAAAKSGTTPATAAESDTAPAAPAAAAEADMPAAAAAAAAESDTAAATAAGPGTSNSDAGAVPPSQGASGSSAVQAPAPPKLPLTEGELLEHLHQDGWLPGLVRYHKFEQSDAKIELKIGKETHVRFKEILHLASVGKPLSQCTSPQHLLEVAYDLTETHLQMLERDVLHRDLSWFNVMCDPEHHPETKAKQVLPGIPCVKKIFGDENGEPAVLLVDLDHAAHVDRIWKPGYVTGIERTGTPMFVALELSGVDDDNRVDYTRGLDDDSVQELTDALKAVEGDKQIFERAFHGDSGKIFMDNFAQVLEREKARKMARPRADLYSDPREVHRAHHDVQSIYWTLLWSFARALPKGSEPYSKTHLDSFCHLMLTHELGYEVDRQNFFQDAKGCRGFLHERFRHFARLFRSLALYFSIPWHVYVEDGTVNIDHAHHAIRRLLLRELIFLRTPDGQGVNHALDTTQPRIYMAKGTTADRKTLPSGMMPAVPTTRGTGTKRKFAQADVDPQAKSPDAKKAKVEEAPAQEREVKENDGKAQAHPRSAKVLQEIFRESRLLWFGTGRRG